MLSSALSASKYRMSHLAKPRAVEPARCPTSALVIAASGLRSASDGEGINLVPALGFAPRFRSGLHRSTAATLASGKKKKEEGGRSKLSTGC